MRVSFRMATIGAVVGIIVSCAVVVFLVLATVGQATVTALVRHTLRPSAALATRFVEDRPAESPENLVKALADILGARVTILWADGEVAADSHVLPQDRGVRMVVRPEVTEALLEGEGFSRRRSVITGKEYAFSARSVQLRSGAAVLRVGFVSEDIERILEQAWRSLALALLLVGLGCVVVVGFAAQRVARGLRGVAANAQEIAGGEKPSQRLPLSPIAELALISSAINQLGSELEALQAQGVRERDEVVGFMDQIAEGLLALTEDARVLRINPAAKTLLGIEDAPLYAPIGSLVQDNELRGLLEQSVIKNELRVEILWEGRHLQVTTRRLDNGGSVVLLLDVSEVRRLEAVRTDFVAAASHELKTPLTVIRGAAETVMDDELPTELRGQFLRSIHGNAVRLQRLVDDLLDLSRFESGTWKPHSVEASVAEIARYVWQQVLPATEDRDLRFEVSGDAVALVDESALYQIFQNLFDNAIRYTPAQGGFVQVTITGAGDQAEVAVSDNGTGIPTSDLPRIFERFYRVDAARSRAEGGTGLGLAIARHLVSAMGGTIWAESELGVGSTIRFTVPRVDLDSTP